MIYRISLSQSPTRDRITVPVFAFLKNFLDFSKLKC